MLSLYALTLFLSAFLLFLVQPMVAKMVLPLLGGTPSVWVTCMLFFQVALLAGYAYAHVAPARLGLKRHALLHAVLLVVPLVALLPIDVAGWTPPADANPVAWLLQLLAVSVGLPFLLVSTSAPLLQRWFAVSGHRAAHDPYFLYAGSNLGSMVALLSYPSVIEPAMGLARQGRLWTLGYAALVLLTVACAFLVWRSVKAPHPRPAPASEPRLGGVAWSSRLRWVGWAFVPSSLLLGATTFITTDVAPVPLLWVLPLAIYLLTFILAFSRLPVFIHRLMVLLLPVMVLLLLLAVGPDDTIKLGTGTHTLVEFQNPLVRLDVPRAILVHLTTLFVASMVCHGELAASRPLTGHLTEYYLWISVGGALGGTFNAVIAPQVFNRIVEYPLVIALTCLFVPHLGRRAPAHPDLNASARRRPATGAAFWILFGLLTGSAFYQASYGPVRESIRLMERTFFGVVSVRGNESFVQMIHGTTSHGMQCRIPAYEREPLTYFTRAGPIGQFFAAFKGDRAKRNVAVIGLGAGTLASYAERGQDWTFYEIDSAVAKIARDTQYFTYLRDAEARGAHVQIILGDGRLRIQESKDQYDLIVLDAFSSDSIPVHLLTREALQVYLSKLNAGGILIFQLTNAYLRLPTVAANLVEDANLFGVIQLDDHVSPAEFQFGRYPSRWAVVARKAADLAILQDPRWQKLTRQRGRVWTDDYSNVLSVFIWNQINECRRLQLPDR